MRKYLKHFSSFILVPLTKWYLRKERSYSYKNIRVTVKPGVFHPGLFYSTKFLLSYLADKDLKEKRFLELGCGTGLISIFAAMQNALVTASDISRSAIENCKINAKENNVHLTIQHSDLFENIARQTFDYIVINPPYYAKDALTEADYAWFCGKEFEYFHKLFEQLPEFASTTSDIIMVLTKGCDLQSIFSIASKNGYSFILVEKKAVLFDGEDFLYKIRKTS
jgi:release factor glutamine methyltransferase